MNVATLENPPQAQNHVGAPGADSRLQFVVPDDSMSAPGQELSLPAGSVVSVDSSIAAAPGDLVLVQSPGGGQPQVRRLVSRHGSRMLETLSPGHARRHAGSGSVIGVVVQVSKREEGEHLFGRRSAPGAWDWFAYHSRCTH